MTFTMTKKVIVVFLKELIMNSKLLQSHMKKLFTEGFTARDIAEPLLSFDKDKSAEYVRKFMSDNNLHIIGIRNEGVVTGYVEPEDLVDGSCGDYEHRYDEGTVLNQASSFRDVIDCLDRSKYCFVSVLGNVGGVITHSDIQKPPVRMWLFGMISILEMFVSRTLKEKYKDSSWQAELTANRLNKAKKLQEERNRRNQHVDLLDCLPLSDKAQILMKNPDFRAEAGYESKRAAEQGIRAFESLRNNLAHAHDIVTYDWETIVAVSQRLDKIMTRI